MMVLDQNII